jgi:hypothetical protein
MNAILRHFAVRLWLTAVLGGLFCLLWLPWWQRPFGLEWAWVPAAATLATAFVALGWCMNRLGCFLLHRQIREAAVWERGGRTRQARAAYDRAAALFDSFWLSPLQRRRSDGPAAGQVVRFYLAQAELTPISRRILASYFQRNPRDAGAAERWLEHLLEQERYNPAEHEAAMRVGDSLVDHTRIQRLMMRFYLFTSRTDFSALQTYRRVWRATQDLSSEEIIRLARLLLSESLINDWALSVYLKAHAAGAVESLKGIKAAVRLLRPDSTNRVDLEHARALCIALGQPCDSSPPTRPDVPAASGPAAGMPLEGLSDAPPPQMVKAERTWQEQRPQQRRTQTPPVVRKTLEPQAESIETGVSWRFQSGPFDADLDVEETPPASKAEHPEGLIKKGYVQIRSRAKGHLVRFLAAADRLVRLPAATPLKPGSMATMRKAAFAAVVVAIVVTVSIAGWRSVSRPPVIVAEPAIPSAPPAITDPFTIQVAAYLRVEDAIRYTERLRKSDLDAFYAAATSANRKWYQVKVSHFATRSQAREYGEQLKAKGLIDDFYVANYNPEDARRRP